MGMRGIILAVGGALLVPAVAMADTGKVTLPEAVTLALSRNHLIRAATFDRQAAAESARAKRSRYLPRVFLDEGAVISNSPTRVFMMKLDEGRFTENDFQTASLNHPRSWGEFQTRFSLEQPLLDLGIGAGAELADRETDAQRHGVEKRREEVALAVVSAWLDVRRGAAQQEAARKGVEDAAEHLRLARVRSGSGVGLKSDELRAGTFLAEMEQRAVTAGNDFLLARLRLAQAAGGGPGESLDIAGGTDLFSVLPDRSDAELVELALANRPDLKALEEEVRRGDAEVRLARSAYLPTIYGGASYQMNDRDIPFGRDNDSWYAGATLRWELFDGMRRARETESARARRQAAEERAEELRRQLVLQVTETRLRRVEAEKRLDLARRALADADEAVRLISRRFENSLATMADLLDAETALNRVRAQVIENESDYVLATARVYYAAGLLTKEIER